MELVGAASEDSLVVYMGYGMKKRFALIWSEFGIFWATCHFEAMWGPRVKSKEELERILEVFGFVLEMCSREFISLIYVFR